MRTFRSPNSGQTSLTLQHATNPRSGYRPPAGHNADGYMMPERVGFKSGGSAVSKSGGITHKSQSGIGPSKKSQKKYYDKQRDAVREMNMSGRGKQLRYESFTDRKTGRLVPDTERNRERYGKDRIYKSPEKITKIWKKGKPTYKAKGGWIQDVNKSIKKRKTKGKCTPITKKGCTGRAKALAMTFKKMGRARKGK